MLVLAHLGHWYIQLIYAAPLLALVIIGLVEKQRQKRREGRRDPRGDPDRKRDG